MERVWERRKGRPTGEWCRMLGVSLTIFAYLALLINASNQSCREYPDMTAQPSRTSRRCSLFSISTSSYRWPTIYHYANFSDRSSYRRKVVQDPRESCYPLLSRRTQTSSSLSQKKKKKITMHTREHPRENNLLSNRLMFLAMNGSGE